MPPLACRLIVPFLAGREGVVGPIFEMKGESGNVLQDALVYVDLQRSQN